MIYLIVCIFLLALIWALGPQRPRLKIEMNLPQVTDNLEVIEAELKEREAAVKDLRPDNHGRILWADASAKQSTATCLLCLHGFSASPMEGAELAAEVATRYGMNLYVPRLHGHGITEAEPLLNLTAEQLLESSLEAFAVAKKLGDQVLIMGTSTGATLGMMMATAFSEVCGMILYSPNIRLADPKSALLSMPWGLPIAQRVVGSNYYSFEPNDYNRKYWTFKYRLESLVELQRLLVASMHKKTFVQVKVPVFMGYYFQNKENQDTSVSVAAALQMFDELGTPPTQKRKVAFPDANEHVIANPHLSGAYNEVKAETFRFVEEVLQFPTAILGN